MELTPTAPAPLLVLALPEETRPLLRRLAPALNARFGAPKKARRGRFGREFSWPTLRVLTTSMGPRNAREAFADALQSATPAWVITGGIAGGLDPALLTGDARFEADGHFPKLAAFNRLGLVSGRFLLVDQVAATAVEKSRLRAESGADLVDMESAAIRALCRAAGLPSATVRTVSDSATEDLPLDFSRLVDADQQLVWWKLAGALLGSPGRIPHLRQLQRNVTYAADRLAEILHAVVTDETTGAPGDAPATRLT